MVKSVQFKTNIAVKIPVEVHGYFSGASFVIEDVTPLGVQSLMPYLNNGDIADLTLEALEIQAEERRYSEW